MEMEIGTESIFPTYGWMLQISILKDYIMEYYFLRPKLIVHYDKMCNFSILVITKVGFGMNYSCIFSLSLVNFFQFLTKLFLKLMMLIHIIMSF